MKINCVHTEMRDVINLVEHPKNYNKHSDRQIELLAKIMNFQGWRHPIIVSKRSGFIVAGHGRIMAAKKLGWDKCPIDLQDFADEATELAFLVADNKIAELAETDEDLLLDIGVALGDDFDHELLGLDEELIIPDEEKDAIEDEVPEISESISKLGDLYELGEHRLMCGDSTSAETVALLMNGVKADMVFTDPPYGIKCDTKSVAAFSKNKSFDDSKPFDLTKLAHLDLPFVIWGGNYYEPLPMPRTEIGWVVWDKRPTRETWDQETRDSADRRFGQHFEIAVTNSKYCRGKMLRLTWGGYYGTVGKPDEQIVHKTQKPTGLLDMCAGSEHKRILDYFGGSGSTLIACEKTRRKCFMMELDPHYIDVIVTRWCKYTGTSQIKRNGEPMNWTLHQSK